MSASELHARFKQALWQEWDPIGVNQYARAFGEYDEYAIEACHLATAGVAVDVIADYLLKIERDHMALGLRAGARARCRRVAEKLVSLVEDGHGKR